MEASVSFGIEQAQVAGEESVILQLPRRAQGDLEEAPFIPRGRPTAALRDVRGDRHGGPPELGGESEALIGGEGARRPIRLESSLVRPLPDHQPTKVIHALRIAPCRQDHGADSRGP